MIARLAVVGLLLFAGCETARMIKSFRRAGKQVESTALKAEKTLGQVSYAVEYLSIALALVGAGGIEAMRRRARKWKVMAESRGE